MRRGRILASRMDIRVYDQVYLTTAGESRLFEESEAELPYEWNPSSIGTRAAGDLGRIFWYYIDAAFRVPEQIRSE